MSRPLMQHGVQQLRDMFDQSKADAGVLRQLEHELRHRQVPRAAVLLVEVQSALSCASDAGVPAAAALPSPIAALPRQPDLWARSQAQPTAVSGSTSATSSARAAAPAVAPVVAPVAAAPLRAMAAPPAAARANAPPPPRAATSMTVDEAFKLLKTVPSATWESIEATRCLQVQQSSPARTSAMGLARRTQALEEARRVNDAYAVLSRLREGGR